jgi:hypothetical protein
LGPAMDRHVSGYRSMRCAAKQYSDEFAELTPSISGSPQRSPIPLLCLPKQGLDDAAQGLSNEPPQAPFGRTHAPRSQSPCAPPPLRACVLRAKIFGASRKGHRSRNASTERRITRSGTTVTRCLGPSACHDAAFYWFASPPRKKGEPGFARCALSTASLGIGDVAFDV